MGTSYGKDVSASADAINEWFFGTVYYRGDHSFEGFIPERPLTNRQRTLREVDGLIRLLNLSTHQGLSLLDAPCGYGRHLIELARRGYRVSGLDLSDTFVRLARMQLRADGLNADVHDGELAKLPFAGASVDVILNMFFAFGFYEEESRNRACLREFARVLKPGGRLLFHTDVNVSQFTNGTYRQPNLRHLEDGAILRIEETFDAERKRLVGSWTLEESEYAGGATHTRRFSMRVYGADEFQSMCRKAGFSDVVMYGGFDERDTDYSETSNEMIVVATR